MKLITIFNKTYCTPHLKIAATIVYGIRLHHTFLMHRVRQSKDPWKTFKYPLVCQECTWFVISYSKLTTKALSCLKLQKWGVGPSQLPLCKLLVLKIIIVNVYSLASKNTDDVPKTWDSLEFSNGPILIFLHLLNRLLHSRQVCKWHESVGSNLNCMCVLYHTKHTCIPPICVLVQILVKLFLTSSKL